MQLFMVGASPYARKVRASAEFVGLGDTLEIKTANPHTCPPELVEKNPLSKVPTLVTEDGEVIFDSFCICEYLDQRGGPNALLPADGRSRRDTLQRHALAHGVMDCAVTRRLEGLRRKDPDRDAWVDRQIGTIGRVLDYFEASGALDGPMTLDRITLAAALEFLDFRFPDDGWRADRPRLTAWLKLVSARPEMVKTQPYE